MLRTTDKCLEVRWKTKRIWLIFRICPLIISFCLRRGNFKNGLKFTSKTSIPQWYGDKMDHEMAVDMLLARE